MHPDTTPSSPPASAAAQSLTNITDRSELQVEYPGGGVAVVRLHRPQATNALSLNLQALLSEAFTQLAADPQVRAIVLTGGEKVFALIS